MSEGFEVLCPLSMTLRYCSLNHLKTLKFAFRRFQGKTRETKHNRKMKFQNVLENAVKFQRKIRLTIRQYKTE